MISLIISTFKKFRSKCIYGSLFYLTLSSYLTSLMKMKTIPLFFILTSLISFSQNSNSNKEYYNAFDKVLGLKNTNLSYGILFKEKYVTLKDNHHYFKADQFNPGTVSYRDNDFFDVYLKYDLAEDNLIVKIPGKFEAFSIILEKHLIEKFSIGDHRFIHIKDHGFNEVLFSTTTISIYKKHIKTKKKKLDKSSIYYKFKDNNSYLLHYKDSYFKVNRKKDFIKLFPKQKDFISSYFKTNRRMSKNNFDEFIAKLIQQLSNKVNN